MGQRINCNQNKVRYVTLIEDVELRWSIFTYILFAGPVGVSPTTGRAFQRPTDEVQFFKKGSYRAERTFNLSLRVS